MMKINDANKLTYSVVQLSGFTEISFIDATTLEDLGSFRIKDEKGMAFLSVLSNIFREVRGDYGEYDSNLTARARLDNGTSGTIDFNEF